MIGAAASLGGHPSDLPQQSHGHEVLLPYLFELSNVSDANETAGSHLGSQWRRASGYTWPRLATVIAGERHIGRCSAPSGDGPGLPWEQEADSNPERVEACRPGPVA